MIRNLNRMIKDEEGMGTMQAMITPCIIEIICCINPLDWLCCGPCIFPIFESIVLILVGIVAWPLLILDCFVSMIKLDILPNIFGKISGGWRNLKIFHARIKFRTGRYISFFFPHILQKIKNVKYGMNGKNHIT